MKDSSPFSSLDTNKSESILRIKIVICEEKKKKKKKNEKLSCNAFFLCLVGWRQRKKKKKRRRRRLGLKFKCLRALFYKKLIKNQKKKKRDKILEKKRTSHK
ncbi:hypothetical protein HMI56_004003 [Coelomomyces lativittatus]|nr:hypothetical protein HMI56_004003 [Coelomomyces lativittatus]